MKHVTFSLLSVTVLILSLQLLFPADPARVGSLLQVPCDLLESRVSEHNASVWHDGVAGEADLPASPLLANMARNRPAFCSAIENTCTLCWAAVDGDLATRWSSQFSDPQWIAVDLGVPTRIERVILRWETAYAQAYRIQTSGDGLTWTDIYSTTNGDGGIDDLAVAGAGRYVRMYGTQRAANRGYSLWEFEVYGASDVAYLPFLLRSFPPPTSAPTPTPAPIGTPRPIRVLVDDFSPQPDQGAATYPYNRLDGDRGVINNSLMTFGRGQVTTTIAAGTTWGGGWMSLNHPLREGLPIDFGAILPAQILPAYQSSITGLTVQIARGTPGRTFRLELKDSGVPRWTREFVLAGGAQVVGADLPALGAINELVWVLDHAASGDTVVLDSVAVTATTAIDDTATAVFVWSYSMLLDNWNPATGLVRDKAKDASGDFDAIQATGSLAAATALAEQLGLVSHADAVQIVNRVAQALLGEAPRYHGLWPHFVTVSPDTGTVAIAFGREWSSVDTVIAAIGLLAAQGSLGLDTTGTEQMLAAIDWDDLTQPSGRISMGYTYEGERIPWTWDTFGGESWLVELAYASATGRVAPLINPAPPTANGAGFIDELAWLFVSPPSGPDYWGVDWAAYRSAAADRQMRYYPSNYPTSCLTQSSLFGLSAGEVPDRSLVCPGSVYQVFGVGARGGCANDGSGLLGAPVVVPHYAALVASLRPAAALDVWAWLSTNGYFSPLNNVESLMAPAGVPCASAGVSWNQLKGSWNLALQTLGWGRYLAARRGQALALWQAVTENKFLQRGYVLLVPNGPTSLSIRVTTPTYDVGSMPAVGPALAGFVPSSTEGNLSW